MISSTAPDANLGPLVIMTRLSVVVNFIFSVSSTVWTLWTLANTIVCTVTIRLSSYPCNFSFHASANHPTHWMSWFEFVYYFFNILNPLDPHKFNVAHSHSQLILLPVFLPILCICPPSSSPNEFIWIRLVFPQPSEPSGTSHTQLCA